MQIIHLPFAQSATQCIVFRLFIKLLLNHQILSKVMVVNENKP